jgi:3-hydroxyacyl-[acyl-carrier-protein] dehydratase
MRWYWFDKFTEFESGRRAVAVKNVTMAEDYMFEYIPGHPVMPNSLVLEGVAQVGGILVGEMKHFEERIVLAKVSRVHYHAVARPGDTLVYEAVIENVGPDGAFVVGTSRRGQELQAEFEYYLAFLSDRNESRELFEPADFLRMLRAFRLYEVGRDPDGAPLEIPARLLEAELASNTAGSR